MKRFLITVFALLIAFNASALADAMTPAQFLAGKGFAVYTVGGVSDIGIDEALFSGENNGYSLCGCVRNPENDQFGLFWREADGSVYVAKSAVQSLIGAVSPAFGGLSFVGTFVDMCQTCGFDLGVFIQGNQFIFGMPREDADLVALARSLADGCPMLYRIGWDYFSMAIVLPGVY